MQKETENTAMIIRDFNALLSIIARTYRQKINKETKGLNNIINWIALTGICRRFYPRAMEYTLLKCTHNVVQDTSHVRSQNKS